MIEPISERDFAAQSCGIRPKRGCKEVLGRVDTLLKQGYSRVIDADSTPLEFLDWLTRERNDVLRGQLI